MTSRNGKQSAAAKITCQTTELSLQLRPDFDGISKYAPIPTFSRRHQTTSTKLTTGGRRLTRLRPDRGSGATA
jgi:hypothetical protein